MKKAIRKLPGVNLVENIFATATFKQSSITFMGTVLNGALGAVFYILAARFLGPASFGLMSVAIAALTLISDIGDFGTNAPVGEIKAFYKAVDIIAGQLGIKDGGYRSVANTGANGGQEVPHFHLHLLGGKKIGALVSG